MPPDLLANREAALEASRATIGTPLTDVEKQKQAAAFKAVKPPGKLGAEQLTPEEQKRRFIDAAREAGCSEDEADFDAALKRIAKPIKALESLELSKRYRRCRSSRLFSRSL